jgi:hypothetical protein
MLAMNKVQPPAKTPKEFFRVRAKNRAIWHSANDLGFSTPVAMGYHLIRHSLVRIMILLSLLLNRRDRREIIILERESLLLSRSIGLVVLKATLELHATRVHILIEIKRMCPSRRALLVRDGLQSSHQDLSAIQLAI